MPKTFNAITFLGLILWQVIIRHMKHPTILRLGREPLCTITFSDLLSIVRSTDTWGTAFDTVWQSSIQEMDGCIFLYVLVWSQRARERLDFQQSKISAKQGERRKHHWTASEMWYAAVSLWSSSGNMFHFCFMKRRLITSCLKLPLSAEVLPINLPCRKLKPAGSSCSEVISLYSDKLRLNALALHKPN